MADAPVPLRGLLNVKEKAGEYSELHIDSVNWSREFW